MNNKKFVLKFHDYTGDDYELEFDTLEEATSVMEEDLNVELLNMNDEYNDCYKYTQTDTTADLWVSDSDIYYEWRIEDRKVS